MYRLILLLTLKKVGKVATAFPTAFSKAFAHQDAAMIRDTEIEKHNKYMQNM